MLTWLLLVLVGCVNTIPIEVEFPTCTDWTPGAEGVIEASERDGDWAVTHTNVVRGCDDTFEPEVVGDGRILTVHELWNTLTEDDCTVCFEPTIVLIDPPPGAYELGWYEEGEEVPVDVVDFEVE